MKPTLTKYILKYIFLVLPIELFGLLALAVILPSQSKKKHKLPKCVNWFDSADGYLDSELGHDPSTGSTNENLSSLKLFGLRYLNLAIRNPADYYKHFIIGERQVIPDDVETLVDFNKKIQRVSKIYAEGYVYNHYTVSLKCPFKRKKRLEIDLGYTLHDAPDVSKELEWVKGDVFVYNLSFDCSLRIR